MTAFTPSARRRRAGTAPVLALLTAALLVAGCGDTGRLRQGEDTGPRPQLAEPRRGLVPTVHVARAVGWAEGQAPRPAAGLVVQAFAAGLAHPRWLHVLPNGDVLVAESNKPAKAPEGLRGRVMAWVMDLAGAGVASADRISLLRDADGDGRAEQRHDFLTGLHSPIGMALVGDRLFVANADGVRRFTWRPGATRLDGPGEPVTDLPGGPVNHHWTKTLVASPDGRTLYAGVGSNSNVGERGPEAEAGRAAVWAIDVASGTKRLHASGLRNPVGLAFEPGSGALWAVVNERDELGSDLVPDYLTRVQAGGFYGWPWTYWGDRVDDRVQQPPWPPAPGPALVPDYALGNHVAPLGLAFVGAGVLPPPFQPAGAVIGLHGSWNRRPHSGYQVVQVAFADGRPIGRPQVLLDGFLDAEGRARGRPVGVAVDGRGGVLVADDVGNTVWRLSPAARR
ncbi:sorbosone dehydrogenase family protein [Aquabacterium sp. J223]|uniref:PQQ-dependent sugar dehydrogenase n=1 Tax=Aquabacterium sp. J223 TaxID=2898431 RepID=UPI0021AD5D82|nr:sorbosone dehydrogenase family protein [Aquabacterium sp. J223]UUX95587.1 sorbosone dehydrogenase family protein [Aquabacterium sp. J223]